MDRMPGKMPDTWPSMRIVGAHSSSLRVCYYHIILKHVNIKVLSDVFSSWRVNRSGTIEYLHEHVLSPASEVPPQAHEDLPPLYSNVAGPPRYDDVAGIIPPPNYAIGVKERDAHNGVKFVVRQETTAVDI